MLTVLLQVAASSDGAERLAATRPGCPSGPNVDGDVVVCAHPTDQRLRPLPALPEARHVDPASFRLPGGGTAHLHAIRSELPGADGSGAAITFTVPFGRGKKGDDSR